jgi:hypothetical protein
MGHGLLCVDNDRRFVIFLALSPQASTKDRTLVCIVPAQPDQPTRGTNRPCWLCLSSLQHFAVQVVTPRSPLTGSTARSIPTSTTTPSFHRRRLHPTVSGRHQSPIHPRPLQRRSGPCQHTYVQIPQRATPRPEPTSGTELFPFLTRAKCILVHWNFLPIAKGLLDSSSACSCHVYDPVVCTSIPQNVKSTRNVGVLQKLGPDKQVRYRSYL